MNTLAVIIVLFLVACAYMGYRKGFVKSFFQAIAPLATIILVLILAPGLANNLSNSELNEILAKECRDTFALALTETEISLDDEYEITMSGRELQNQIIDHLEIPKILKGTLKNNNTAEVYKKLSVAGFNEYVPRFLSNLIIQIISYIIVWIVVSVIVGFVIRFLDKITHFPGVNITNKLFGMIIGLGRGLLMVWVFFLVVTVLGNTHVGRRMLEMISESAILESLYYTNILMVLIRSFF